jgi:hypothetical protein
MMSKLHRIAANRHSRTPATIAKAASPLLVTGLTLMLAASVLTGCRTGQVGAVVNATKPFLTSQAGLSENTIIQGLKEALQVGTSRAVDKVSGPDGYLQNPDIRIPLPQEVQQAESLIRTAGFGGLADEFLASMNRAASKAAPEAGEVFWQAISEMSFAEARSILDGQDDAATQFFQNKTRDELSRRFRPVISQTMSNVGVTRTYQRLHGALATLPGVEMQSLDLKDYVTNRALDGLFTMLAREEKAIRENPTARTTALLQRVFGSNGGRSDS